MANILTLQHQDTQPLHSMIRIVNFLLLTDIIGHDFTKAHECGSVVVSVCALLSKLRLFVLPEVMVSV